ncbi:right-handed parallel beta-helix repeat-containing protein [bacterium]|nr:right-handed parallel beta-helix repeat-containing protein [bacterium]
MTQQNVPRLAAIILPLLLLLTGVEAKTRFVHPTESLQEVVDRAAAGDTLVLQPGLFHLAPRERSEALCGNCENHQTVVHHTYGLLIDKPIVLLGEDRDQTVLVTHAGYGVLFENAGRATLERMTITGGIRDLDGAATDAAVVARQTRLTISDCSITENNHRADSVVVGIAGIVGREGADLLVENCLIRGNSWDGIALYRGARALIRDNIIADGRGVGIGVTWDAVATIQRNDVSGYWKGIGSFGSSHVVLRDNVVHDVLGWGIIATGSSTLDCVNNIIARAGNCGFAVWSEESRGRLVNTVIYAPGWRDEWVCPRVGVWNNGPNDAFLAHNNIIFDPEEEAWRASFWSEGSDDAENTTLPPDSTLDGRFMILDPCFTDPDNNDFRPLPSSPLLDRGSLLESDVDGSRANIGLSDEALQRFQPVQIKRSSW